MVGRPDWRRSPTGQAETALIDVSSSRIVSIEAGSYHTCLLDEAGDVKCWGWNGYGQIGDGSFTNSYSPNTVAMGTILQLWDCQWEGSIPVP